MAVVVVVVMAVAMAVVVAVMAVVVGTYRRLARRRSEGRRVCSAGITHHRFVRITFPFIGRPHERFTAQVGAHGATVAVRCALCAA